MKIQFKKLEGKTGAGHGKFEFFCEDCNERFWYNFHWFYDKRLNYNKRTEKEAKDFCHLLNSKQLKKITDNKKLRWQIYSAVCNCDKDAIRAKTPKERLQIIRAKKLIDPSIIIPEQLVEWVKNSGDEKTQLFWSELEDLGVEVRELVYDRDYRLWGFKIVTNKGMYLDYAKKSEIIKLVKRDNGR